jgi:hypothetical protein
MSIRVNWCPSLPYLAVPIAEDSLQNDAKSPEPLTAAIFALSTLRHLDTS